MIARKQRGIATAVMVTLMVVIIAVAGGAVYVTSTQKSTTTETSTATTTETTTATSTATVPVTTTIISPPVTSTETTTLPPSTSTTTVTGPTSTVAGPTTTVTTTSTSTTTASPVITTTTTKTVTSYLLSTTATVTVTGSSQSLSSSSSTIIANTTSTSCTTNTTSTTSLNETLDALTFIQSFSRATVTLGGNTTQGPEILNYTYVLVYASRSGPLTTYKVDFSYSVQQVTLQTTAWILSNGTLLAVESEGQNYTGSSTELYFLVGAAPFIILGEFDASPISSIFPVSQIHAAGQENVTIGDINMLVTDYRANSLPLVFTECPDTYSLTTFLLKEGIVPGTNFTLLTYLDMQGSVQEDSTPSQPYGILIQVTSITLA